MLNNFICLKKTTEIAIYDTAIYCDNISNRSYEFLNNRDYFDNSKHLVK